jgi:hypothetical protein
MSDHERPGTPDPSAPTQPIRPQQGSEPIPERVRQPIVVPRPESTIAGLPRPLVVAAAVALLVALGAGFLIGRAVGGADGPAEEGSAARGGACRKALSLSLQVVELQKQALANRTEAAQALVLEEEARVGQLNEALEPLAAALQQAEGQLVPAAERCRAAEGRAGRGDRRRGNRDNPRGDA